MFEFIAKNGFNLSALSNKHFWLVHLRNTIPADVSDLFTDYSAIFWKLLIISLMFAAVGAVAELNAVWTVSDIFNGLMAFLNLPGLIILRKNVKFSRYK